MAQQAEKVQGQAAQKAWRTATENNLIRGTSKSAHITKPIEVTTPKPVPTADGDTSLAIDEALEHEADTWAQRWSENLPLSHTILVEL